MSRARKVMATLFAFAALGVCAAPAASAAIEESNNNGHPNKTPAANCAAGKNTDARPGALNKFKRSGFVSSKRSGHCRQWPLNFSEPQGVPTILVLLTSWWTPTAWSSQELLS